MTKIKETIYDTNEVDNLYKIVDKLVELRNDPFKYDDCEPVEVFNPYSGQGCVLPRFARGVYIAIKNAEVDGKYNKMQKLLDWFSRNFTKEYFVLLD